MSLRNGELREENGHGAKKRILPQAGRAAWGRGGCVKGNGLLLNRSNPVQAVVEFRCCKGLFCSEKGYRGKLGTSSTRASGKGLESQPYVE